MKSFKELFVEVFDETYPFKFIKKKIDPGSKAIRYNYEFEDDDNRKIYVSAKVYFNKNEEKELEINFYVRDRKGMIQYTKTDNSSNPYKVFGTILEIVKEVAKKEKVDTIYFAADADEPSRVKLYDRLSKFLSKKFHLNLKKEIKDYSGIKSVNYYLSSF